jgi:nitroreductase
MANEVFEAVRTILAVREFDAQVREEFALPEGYNVVAVLPLGCPRRRIHGRKKRKPFNQVVSAERFGLPLS